MIRYRFYRHSMNYLNNLTIKNRLFLLVAVMFVASLLMTLLNLKTLKNMNERLGHVHQNITLPLTNLSEIRRLLIDNKLHVTNGLLFPEKKLMPVLDIKANIEQSNQLWQIYNQHFLTPEEKIIADKYTIDNRKFISEGLEPAIEYINDGKIDLLREHILKNINKLFLPVSEDIDQLIALHNVLTRQHYDSSQSEYDLGVAISIVYQIFGLLFSVLIIFNIIRFLTAKLGAEPCYVASVVKQISQGQLSVPIVFDETNNQSLLYSINELRQTLKLMITDSSIAMSDIAKGQLASRMVAPLSGDFIQFKEQTNQSLTILSHALNNVKIVAEAIVAGNFNAGNFDVIGNDATNEFIAVIRALKTLQDVCREMTQQRWVKLHTAEISDQIYQAENFQTFSEKLLSALCPLLNVGHGILYIYSEDKLNLSGSYGYKQRKHLNQSFNIGEGLIGQCAIERKMITLTNPPENYIKINSGLGEATPKNLTLLPIINNNRLLGVIELASFALFTETEDKLLTTILPVISTTMEILERNIQTKALLNETQQQAALMKIQAVQLENQTAEMTIQQKALENTQTWFRSIIESSPDSIIVADNDGKILLCNYRAEEIFGYAKGELIGKNIDNLVPLSIRSVHHKMRSQFMQEGKKRLLSSERGSIKGVRQDGSEFLAEISLSMIPNLLGDGFCAFASVQNITEQVEANEKLRLVNYQNELALNLAKAGCWQIHLNEPDYYVSSERTAQLLGDPIHLDWRYHIIHDWFVHLQIADEMAAEQAMIVLKQAIEGQIAQYDVTFAYKRPEDKQIIWLRNLGHVVFDNETGEPTDIYGLSMDITERKLNEDAIRAAKELAEEATKLKSNFLANMSHEIRTPMNAIIGMSNLVLKTALTQKQRNYIQKVEASGKHLLGIILSLIHI